MFIGDSSHINVDDSLAVIRVRDRKKTMDCT